jgi:hypothetical protein
MSEENQILFTLHCILLGKFRIFAIIIANELPI